MENSRKQLKTSSILLLILAGLTALNAAFEIIFGAIANAEIPEGSPDNILLITQIVLAVVTLLMLLPQIYIGVKGLKIAKKPNSSKGHIVWGIILLVFTILSLVPLIVAIVNLEDVFANVAGALSIAVDASILFAYVKHAIIISKAN